VPLIALFVVLFGVVAGLTLAGASESNATQMFLASLLAQDNAVANAVVSLLMLAVFALAAATIGSLFAAALDVIERDLGPTMRSRPTAAAGASDGKRAGPASIAALVGGALMLALILATFVLAEMRSEHSFGIAGLLGAMLAFSSVQMALVPLALVPLLRSPDRPAGVTPVWALAVLAVGAAIGVGITVAGLVFGQAAVLPFAVPVCFVATALVFLIGLRMRPAEAAADSPGRASG